jgi:hypothetical protein
MTTIELVEALQRIISANPEVKDRRVFVVSYGLETVDCLSFQNDQNEWFALAPLVVLNYQDTK